jgi:hypothetical protein
LGGVVATIKASDNGGGCVVDVGGIEECPPVIGQDKTSLTRTADNATHELGVSWSPDQVGAKNHAGQVSPRQHLDFCHGLGSGIRIGAFVAGNFGGTPHAGFVVERNRGCRDIDQAATISDCIEHIGRTPNIDVIGVAPARTRCHEGREMNYGFATLRRRGNGISVSYVPEYVSPL